MRGSRTVRAFASAVALLAATAAQGGVAACTGDCDGDKVVGIAELVTMVNVALGRATLPACPNGDRDGDGVIAIDELVRAVRHALAECEGDIEPRPYKTSIDHPFDPYLAFSATPRSSSPRRPPASSRR